MNKKEQIKLIEKYEKENYNLFYGNKDDELTMIRKNTIGEIMVDLGMKDNKIEIDNRYWLMDNIESRTQRVAYIKLLELYRSITKKLIPYDILEESMYNIEYMEKEKEDICKELLTIINS